MNKAFFWGAKLFTVMLLAVLTVGSVSAKELNSGNVSTYCRTGRASYVLDCSNSNIDTIGVDTFLSGYSDRTVLNLGRNPISSIESGAFAGLSNLQEFNLEHNNALTSIRSLNFSGLSNLKRLKLDYIDLLTGVEEGDFVGLSNLEELSLSYNDALISIEEGDFVGLPNLKKLTLDRNRGLTNIGSGSFASLPALKNLTIQNNFALTGIKSGIFAGLSGLTGLYLNANKIESIENGVFAGLPNVEELRLNYNNISTLEPSIFSGLLALKTLRIYDNPITAIESGAFLGLTNLEKLDMGRVNLTGLKSSFFSGLSSLTWLGLYGSQISNIESGTFVGLSNLQSLYLEENKISSIEAGLFAGLGVLEVLDLSSNAISSIGSGAFPSMVSSRIVNNPPLGPSPVVTRLALNDNNITTLPGEILTSGDYINLHNNCLDFDLLTQGQIDYLDTKNERSSWKDTQKVCSVIEYTPATETTGSVVGNIVFAGGVSGQREELYTLNPTITNITHTWTENGLFGFDLSGLVNTGSYLKSLSTLTGKVDRIIPYVAPVVPTKPTVGFAGGGAGGSSTPTTPTQPTTPTTPTTPSTPSTPTAPTTLTDPEQVSAYKRAYNAGVTTQPTLSQARLENTINRGELAKMLAVYAKEQLKKAPDSTKACTYTDANTTSEELAGYMKEVCQLGIMGLQGDGTTPLEMFNPNETVTRAQLVTTISRLLYGNKYDTNSENRWSGHMNILKADGVVNKTDPTIVELRGRVILMLYRLQ